MKLLLVSATPSFGPKILRDSLRKIMGEIRDNFGTDLDEIGEKLRDRSRWPTNSVPYKPLLRVSEGLSQITKLRRGNLYSLFW